MQVLDYLKKCQNVSFKELPFNEVDALVLSMVSYCPFDEINLEKKKTPAKLVYTKIENYVPPLNISERKSKYLELTKAVCQSKRYKKAVFAFFKKERDESSAKQFQAITIILKEFAFVSFCGTDSTTLGWKEDFDMSYLEVVPSEIEGIKYLHEVNSRFLFKKIYVGGHSKGGRIAISAAKGLKKRKRLLGIYAFDAPNYPSSFYDKEYKAIDKLIHSYAPEESIIGRLMMEYRRKEIIASSNTLLLQHDAFSWLLSDHSFEHRSKYSERSSRIVDTLNYAMTHYDEDHKKLFVDTVFDYLAHLNIKTLPDEKIFKQFFFGAIPFIKEEWNNTSKEKRAIIRKMLFDIGKNYLLKKKTNR